MTQTKIPVASATDAQLREFGALHKGLSLHHNLGREKILAALSATGFDVINGEIEAAGPIETAPPPRPAGVPAADAEEFIPGPQAEPRTPAQIAQYFRTGPRVRILIPAEKGKGGQDDVPVGVNGYVIQIKRGVAVEIPEAHYKHLSSLYTAEYEQGPDGNMLPPRNVPAKSQTAA